MAEFSEAPTSEPGLSGVQHQQQQTLLSQELTNEQDMLAHISQGWDVRGVVPGWPMGEFGEVSADWTSPWDRSLQESESSNMEI